MLKRIEPLDNSIVSKGVSDSAKDSMKQTISTMLGLLPSDQFSVTVRFSKRHLDRLIVSSIVTGYTLWNAEYRISLMRNFDISLDSTKRVDFEDNDGGSEVRWEESEKGVGVGVERSAEGLETMNLKGFGDLSPEALNYIQQLESELSAVKQELHARKQENLQMEHIKKSNKDLLEYLRSLESDMAQNYQNADLVIGFHRRDHGDGAPFDGPGGTLAHAFAPTNGRFHYDADERWAIGSVANAFDLETVALHEIGHLLGLGHSSVEAAIMFSGIGAGQIKNLHQDDIQGIRALYNV